MVELPALIVFVTVAALFIKDVFPPDKKKNDDEDTGKAFKKIINAGVKSAMEATKDAPFTVVIKTEGKD